jgi:copper(I)-binding protein
MTTRTVSFLLAMGLLATACGSSNTGIEIEDPWGRAAPSVATNGALYLRLVNGGDADRLLQADSDACAALEVHTSVMDDGVMRMQKIDGGVEIPAGGETSLEPGGMHLMCIDKQVDFIAGTTVSVTLDFATAEPQTIEIEIRDS